MWDRMDEWKAEMEDIINHLGDYFFDDIVNLPPTPLRDQRQREGG